MINLSYRFDQNSSSLELSGMPDVSKGDPPNIIGIISSWSLKIIGSPLLEGEKEHLDDLMNVILLYSRSYISGIRKSYISNKKIVEITPFGLHHKLILNSTKKDVKSLQIILDDAELSDLTRCLDLLRFDQRFNIKWNINQDVPFTRKYILSQRNKSKSNYNLFMSLIIFLSSSALLILLPINNEFELRETYINKEALTEEIK
tara:strand:- start:452 stop:1060 length:609 start_codon:yes stop_codon:yes gene_type:complete